MDQLMALDLKAHLDLRVLRVQILTDLVRHPVLAVLMDQLMALDLKAHLAHNLVQTLMDLDLKAHLARN
jgi:hypothetical protein